MVYEVKKFNEKACIQYYFLRASDTVFLTTGLDQYGDLQFGQVFGFVGLSVESISGHH
jgi:hypothetical protein